MKKNQLLKKLLLLTSFFFLSFFCFAQVTEEWVARYDGPGSDVDDVYGRSMAVDAAGNVYVTGRSSGIGTGYDYATIKYNNAGVQQWVRRYNGPANGEDDANSLAVDAAGNVYVTGRSTRTGTDYDYVTIKYNNAGVPLWGARYNGPGNDADEAKSLAVDVAGNVYVTGFSTGGIGTYGDYATIKYNKDGVQQWVRRYNGPGNISDVANSLAVDALGNVYVTGESGGIGTGRDYATIKYNSAGVQQWVRRYAALHREVRDQAFSLAVDASGNVYVTGLSVGIATSTDYATIKYNAAGVVQWVARYDNPATDIDDYDQAFSLALDASGNVYVTGGSIGLGTMFDYATVKYNAGGVEQWVARYNGPGNENDQAFSLAVDALGNVYVTGGSTGLGTSQDYATIKYNATGTNLWVVRYNGPPSGLDRGSNLALDPSGKNIYVAGASAGIGTNSDYATVKYSQLLLPPPIEPIPRPFDPAPIPLRLPIPSNLNKNEASIFRVSNYPNPVSATTRIEYEIPYDGRVNIKMFDVLGREVATLVNADKKAGYHTTDLNASSFQNGVYHYRAILTGRKEVLTQSGKITVIK